MEKFVIVVIILTKNLKFTKLKITEADKSKEIDSYHLKVKAKINM